MYLCWTELFEIELLICIKMDLALNNLQRLICHKNQPTNQPNKQTENNTYVGLTTTTLSRRLTDSGFVAQHLKSHSPLHKSKFWKILVENTTIIVHEINKPWLQS